MKYVLICLMIIAVTVAPYAMAGQVYEWIDEKGVKHFTNEPPPPGATIVGQDKEIPYDAEKDRQRKESDKQFLQQQQQQEQAEKTDAPKAVDAPAPEQVSVPTRDSNTYHQRQVQKEQRIKQEIREGGGRPEAKPLLANRSDAKPAPAKRSEAKPAPARQSNTP